MQTVKISTYQAATLLTITMLATSILLVPSNVASEAGRDAWLSFILGTLLGMLTALLAAALAQKHGNAGFHAIAEKVMGSLPGKLLGLLYLAFYLLLTASLIREFASFMATAFMPLTPISVFVLLFTVSCICTAYLGLEVIARLSEIVLPVIVFFLLLILFLQSDQYELSALLPLLRTPPENILRGAFVFWGWSGQVFFLLLLYPYLEKPGQALKASLIAVSIVGFFLTAGAFSLETVLQYPLTERTVFALLAFVRLINLTGFLLERVDAVVIVIWVAGAFVKASFMLHITSISLAQVFGVTESRHFLLPLAALNSALSIFLFESSKELETFIHFLWPIITLFFLVLIPFLLYFLSFPASKRSSAPGNKGGGQQ